MSQGLFSWTTNQQWIFSCLVCSKFRKLMEIEKLDCFLFHEAPRYRGWCVYKVRKYCHLRKIISVDLINVLWSRDIERMQCLKITKMRITKNIFNSSMHSTTIYMQSIEVMLNSNNVGTLYVVYFRDQYIRGSARQCFGRFSDLTQLQHSPATEMGLDFQCGCGPSL